MNETFASPLPRPTGVGPDSPVPVALNNSFSYDFKVKKPGGGPYPYCLYSGFAITIKANPNDLDANALYQGCSGQTDDPFTVVDNSIGLMALHVPAITMSTVLNVDTNYYVDVQIVSIIDEVYTLIRDTIRPWKQITDLIYVSHGGILGPPH